jgi:hypothetical protein
MVLVDSGDGEVIHPVKGPQIERFLDMLEGRAQGTFVCRVVVTSGYDNASPSTHFVTDAADRDQSVAPGSSVKVEGRPGGDPRLVLDQLDPAEGRNHQNIVAQRCPQGGPLVGHRSDVLVRRLVAEVLMNMICS